MARTAKTLLLALLVLSITSASAQANVTVFAEGTDSGADRHDTLRITGDDTPNVIKLREGFEGDVDASGQPDTCGGNDLLCFLTVESDDPITPQGACQLDGANTKKAKCAYFHTGASPSAHRYEATIRLLDGNDRIEIVQGAIATGAAALTTPWNWAIDFGAGNDIIDGPEVLTVPDERGTLSVKIAGGAGSDLFRGRFAARPTTLLGDDINGAVNVSGTDIFEDIGGGFGVSIQGQGGDDAIFPSSTSIPIDAGAGNDSVGLSGATLDTQGPPAVLDGGPGTDSISYGSASAPALTLHLDGSSPSTGNTTLMNIENATGGPQRDTIIGNNQANRLIGSGGRGDLLMGMGGDDILDVDDGVSGPGGTKPDDTADGGAGEDLILANDAARDIVRCGTSSHTQTIFIDNRASQFSIFDSDRARLDLTDDVAADCEDVQREPVRTQPAAQITRVTLAGSHLRLTLRCPAGVRGGCRGRARAESASGGSGHSRSGVAYRVRSGGVGTVRVPLPDAARRRLAKSGVAIVRAVVVEQDGRGRDRTRIKTALVSRR